MLSKISIFYISVPVQHRARKRQINSRWREASHAFVLRCGEELGEHNRYCVKCGYKGKGPTQSPPDNIKRNKTLDDFIQEKRKERHGFFKKQKKIRNSTGTATCPRTSKVCLRVMTNEIYFQKGPAEYLSRLGNNILQKTF